MDLCYQKANRFLVEMLHSGDKYMSLNAANVLALLNRQAATINELREKQGK